MFADDRQLDNWSTSKYQISFRETESESIWQSKTANQTEQVNVKRRKSITNLTFRHFLWEKCNVSLKTSASWSHWNRPAVRPRPSFMGWLFQEYRNVAKTLNKYTAPTHEKLERIQKDAFNSPYTVCGTGEVCKCAQIWVSALFSVFLRCFEPRELAKLVGQQNLFRDLGFFFSFLKTFPPDKSKGVYLEEWEAEVGMWKSAAPALRKRGVKLYRSTFTWFLLELSLAHGPAVSRHVWFAQFHASSPGLRLGAASSAGTRRQGGWDYFTRLERFLKYFAL